MNCRFIVWSLSLVGVVAEPEAASFRLQFERVFGVGRQLAGLQTGPRVPKSEGAGLHRRGQFARIR
ncbi:MAG: hypothetical protein AAB403_09365, partial [Planctomycetota bacterium]